MSAETAALVAEYAARGAEPACIAYWATCGRDVAEFASSVATTLREWCE